MVEFVGGLDKFLTEKYPEEFVLISFGHMELFTEEMQKEYLEWYKDVYAKENSNKSNALSAFLKGVSD